MRAPIRVLYATPFAELHGGGQESLLLLIERLDRTRFSPLLLVPGEGAVARRARAAGCETEVFELPTLRAPWRTGPAVARLRRLLKARGVSVLHVEQPRAAVYAALARAGLGIPLVWHVRTMLSDPLDPLLERSADKLILVADALKARFSPLGRRKAVVVYNGIDAGPRADAAPGGPVLCAGRLERDKGQRVLLDAVAALRPDFPDLAVWLAGAGDEASERELRAAASGLGGAVRFLGRVDDTRPLYASARVVAVPSFHEAFPRTVLEAMAAAKPVVASRVGGVAEAVADGETGLLVAPGDARALAAALRRLLSDRDLARRMGEAGRARVGRFSVASMVEGVQRVYDDLAAGGTR